MVSFAVVVIIERTGAWTDPVRAKGPESARGKTLIGFGNLFGLQDIYDDDYGVRLQGGIGPDRE